MAYIKDIRFDSVDRKDGLVCDRCGAYIRNIYTVTYSDGLVAQYGMECFKKLFDAGKLTDFGRKLMMKALKRIEDALEALYEFMFLYDTLNLYGSSLTLRYRVDRCRVDKDKNNNITLEVIE